jgi:hypothetical protein
MLSIRWPLLALVCFSFSCSAAIARIVSIITDPNLGLPARHGLEKFEEAVQARDWEIDHAASAASARGERLVFAGRRGMTDADSLGTELPQWPAAAEALAVKNFTLRGKPALLFAGADDRGLMYALLDAAERIASVPDAAEPFSLIHDITEQPAVRGRSLSVYVMNRAHWESRFYDERYWTRYLDLLAASRFNRFLIIFGYENGGFLAPPYPYFFDTPGFPGVHMVGLTREQQARNLAALNRLIELAHARGVAVSLGIWDHIYRAGVQTGGAEWVGDYLGRPIPNSVEGVTTENLNAYTLASLRELVARVPAMDGLQFRVHEESGLTREEMEGFWREVFTHMQKTRPGLFIELRGKGTPDAVIDTAVALGMNFRVETKYWMEQMGLPFHPTHVNPPDQRNRRHGYADFLRYPQRYHMTWRLWNGGTSRILLWGDPDYVRRYSATTELYDSPNWDVQEPLATKMEAQRPDLPTFDLMPAKYRYYDYEFERYWHFFQVWGRAGYNPATPTDTWQREFQRHFGDGAAPHVEAALHRASQVLPMIVAAVYPYSLFPTTRGWAERQSLGAALADYAKNEGTDTELFESFATAAERMASNRATAKRTPAATSRWFDAAADDVLAEVRAAEATIGAKRGNEFDSTITDLKILAQLARFHARRSLAAVHYNLFLRGHNKAELIAATQGEKDAVAAWRELVAIAGDHYAPDLAMGARNYDLCGNWSDELVKLEADLANLNAQCAKAEETAAAQVWNPATEGKFPPPVVEHDRIVAAPVGQPLRIVVRSTDPTGVQSLRLRYRHVTQFEDYATLDMQPTGRPDEYAATIPGEFLESKWDVMYFIEAINRAGTGTMWPDFTREPPCVFVKLQR